MKMRRLMVVVSFLMIAANAEAVVVKGWVRLETTPSMTEIAEEYARTDAPRPILAALQIMKRQDKHGIKNMSIPVDAEVEIQTLPDLKVIGRGKVDKDGNYEISVSRTELLLRARCYVEREEFGRRTQYTGFAHVEQKSQYNSFYTGNITLRRSYASAEGRCVHGDGTPASGVYVFAHPITHGETDEETRLFPMQLAVTDEVGKWHVDGLSSPPIDILMSYICYTNLVVNRQVEHYPLQLRIYARRKPFGRYDAELIIPNITDENHRAAEKAITVSERKSGKRRSRPNPLANFPVSTNDVIYVPDLVVL